MIPTIHAAAEQLRQGRLSPVALLEGCLAQIDRLEASVRAWVLVDRDEAQAQAERCAEELRRGHWRGPLHGVPLAIKDIIDVFDWPTACGSNLWQASVARQDATVVRKLRQAGAVLIGKTATTPYASFDPAPTRNPWGLTRTPGGSSAGSAAAVACGMCLGALASQTGGSIVRPASYCGVPGCKPTFGRASTHGVMPLAPSMDHIGPMARSVRDVALLMQTISGPDPLDPTAAALAVPNWTTALQGPQRPPRLGRLRGLFEDLAHPEMRGMLDRTVARLVERGAIVHEVALPAAFAEVIARHRTIMAVEALAFHEPRLRRHPEDYGPCITGLFMEALATPAAEHARCKEHQKQLRQEMLSCFEGVDALLTPATTMAAPDIATTGDPALNSPWSYTGLPTVSLPVARNEQGLPLAIQLVGRPWGEGETFAAAAWCEDVVAYEIGLPS
jgi:aspartyl-tRNA(Asn)/glutamyl-tRNA(Gln) amidotransferase subunit A